MNSNKLFFAAALVAALAAVSCTKEALEPNTQTPLTGETETLLIRLSGTKTVLNSGRDCLQWVNGDRIGLFTEEQDKYVAVPTYAGADELSVEVPAGSDTLCAYYPYSSAGLYRTKFRQSIGQDQTQAAAGVMNGEEFPMYGKTEIVRTESGATADLKFKMRGSVLALNIYNTSASAPAGAKIESVTVTPLTADGDSVLCGGRQYPNFDTDSGAFTPGSVKFYHLTLTVTEPADIPSVKPADDAAKKAFPSQLYVSIAPYTYPRFKFSVATSDGSVYTGTTGVNNYEFKAGQINVLSLDLKNFSTYNADDYYSMWLSGVDFTIGDNVMNKTNYPTVALVSDPDSLQKYLTSSTVPIFIDNGASFTKTYTGDAFVCLGGTSNKGGSTILIGRYRDKAQPVIKQTSTKRPLITYNQPVVRNVRFEFDALSSGYGLMRGPATEYVAAGLQNYVFEDCTFISSSSIFRNYENIQSFPRSILYRNCIIRAGAAVCYATNGSGDNKNTILKNVKNLQSIVMDNCVIAPFDADTPVNVAGPAVWFDPYTSVADYRCDSLSIDIKSCSFYQFAPSSTKSIIHATTVKDIKMRDNIFATAVEAANRYFFVIGATCSKNASAENIFTGNHLAKFLCNPADYSSAKTYSSGTLCKYSGQIYKCKVAITTAEAWNSDHWTYLGDYGTYKIAWTSTASKTKIQGGSTGTDGNKYTWDGNNLSEESVFGTVDTSIDYYPSAISGAGASYDTKYWVGK